MSPLTPQSPYNNVPFNPNLTPQPPRFHGSPSTAPGTPVQQAPGTPVQQVPGTPVQQVPGTPVQQVPGTPVQQAPGTPVQQQDSLISEEGKRQLRIDYDNLAVPGSCRLKGIADLLEKYSVHHISSQKAAEALEGNIHGPLENVIALFESTFANPLQAKGCKVKYCDGRERQDYALTIQDYDLTIQDYDLTIQDYDLTIQDYDLTISDRKVMDLPQEYINKRLIFVIDTKGTLYAGKFEQDQFHHSSFVSGEDVILAGDIVVNEEGRIVQLTNNSGHYKPSEEDLRNGLRALERQGIEIKNIELGVIGASYHQDVQLHYYNAQSYLNNDHRDHEITDPQVYTRPPNDRTDFRGTRAPLAIRNNRSIGSRRRNVPPPQFPLKL
ncbi:MAG: hypothetical protein ACQEP8_04415 [Chlamydiota bacterium]